MASREIERIKAEKLKELKLRVIELQRHEGVSVLYEKNRDYIKMTFRQRGDHIVPTGFDLKVSGEFSGDLDTDVSMMGEKLTSAILLGYSKMESI